jgi:hypothetical protein
MELVKTRHTWRAVPLAYAQKGPTKRLTVPGALLFRGLKNGKREQKFEGRDCGEFADGRPSKF